MSICSQAQSCRVQLKEQPRAQLFKSASAYRAQNHLECPAEGTTLITIKIHAKLYPVAWQNKPLSFPLVQFLGEAGTHWRASYLLLAEFSSRCAKLKAHESAENTNERDDNRE